jgi:hypothetical protein
MKKESVLIASVVLILILSFSSVFAFSIGNFFNDAWNKITGKVTQGTCSDSDGGGNVAIKGTATDSEKSLTDYCDANGKLVEYTCKDGVATEAWGPPSGVNCSGYGAYVCSDGACILNHLPSCTDSDNGKNYYTQGIVQTDTALYFDVCHTENYIESNPLSERYCEDNALKTEVIRKYL